MLNVLLVLTCCVIRGVGQVHQLIGCVVLEGYRCRRLRLRPLLLAFWLIGTEGREHPDLRPFLLGPVRRRP